MQQTEIYQLNKIDTDDTFSPDPINENTEKLEAALAGMEDRLDQRITTLEGHRLATGTYIGTYDGTAASMTPRTIQLGFTPKMVFIRGQRYLNAQAGLALPNVPVTNNSSRNVLAIVPNGFNVAEQYNLANIPHSYFALL